MQNMKNSFIIQKKKKKNIVTTESREQMQNLTPMAAPMLNLQDSELYKQTLDIIATLASTSSADDLVICHLILAKAVQKPRKLLFLECDAQFNPWRGPWEWSAGVQKLGLRFPVHLQVALVEEACCVSQLHTHGLKAVRPSDGNRPK